MIPFPKRAALAAALATAGVLATPTAASATVAPPVVIDDSLIVTSDDQGDTITLAAAGGVITVNGAATTLNANANAAIVVTAGGGADVVDASALAAANYRALLVDGGGDDDVLTGGANADTLDGGEGNDRLVGFKGSTDLVSGGNGDDVMVWNNGDGSDQNDGGAGTDETEVNGAPTAADVFTFRPSAEIGGWVRLDRTNLGTFNIQLLTERLTVNGLGGNDSASPDPADPTGLSVLTSITLNGGTGEDELTGGDGPDQINGGGGFDTLAGAGFADLIRGGDDADTITGDGGDDRLVGDRGTDFHSGGAGDDVLVWNNGDGTDNDAGDAGFDRVEVNGSAATGGDVFTLAPNGDDAKFERTNQVPFAINLTSGPARLDDAEPNGGVEALSVNGGPGNESFIVAPGLPGLLVAADGGSGDDLLVGDEEADSFFGGSGNDTLAPGDGADLADGEEGNDQLSARDRTGDLVRGGVGIDSAQTDAVIVDAINGVEALDATPLAAPPPSGDTKALLPKVGKAKLISSHGKLVARVPLTCPAAEAGGCQMTLTLKTAKAVRLGGVRAVLVLGSKSADLRPGQRSTVSVRLVGGAAELRRHGMLPVRARIATQDAAGNFAVRSVALGLRFPRR
jgi:Ca2+-binding RTX toxin-like protein